MTTAAFGLGVRRAKDKFPRMAKVGHMPTGGHRLVALLAFPGKPGQLMIGVFRFREVGSVTDLALLRSPGKLVPLLADMARAAIGNGMHSHQWKTSRGVETEIILTVLPALRRVAVLATRTKLSAVDIGVAIGAGSADLREFQIPMTCSAGGAGMRADESEAGFLVLEFHRLFNF
jgi:hypothetical protein